MNILLVAMGISTMVAQIIIMRRLIVVFGGDELVSGIVLAGWLGFSGIGNIIAGRFADRIKDAELATAISVTAMAFVIPPTAMACILAKAALRIPPPVIIGLTQASLPILAILCPLGITIGISFTLACRLKKSHDFSNIGHVYMMDTLGAAIGGISFSLLAIRYFSAVQAAILAAAIAMISVGLSFRRISLKCLSLVCTAILAATLLYSNSIDKRLAYIQWRGYDPVIQKESRFSSLMVTENLGERTLFVDGRPSFSLPLPETYETISNLALIEHENPKDVAIIGGGISGVLNQWKRWNLENAIFIRLDPAETLLELFYMPSDFDGGAGFAQIRYTDGRNLFKIGLPDGCVENCLDVAIVNVGNPDTAATGRYFTVEFLKDVKRILRPDGIFMIGLLDPASAIGDEALRLLGIVRATIGRVFKRTAILPLDRFYFISSDESATITDDLNVLSSRLDERGMGKGYLSTREIAGIFPERVSEFKNKIEAAAATAPINTDLRPIAYHAGMMFWEKRSGGFGSDILSACSKIKWWIGVLFLAGIVGFTLILGKRNPKRARSTFTLACVGLAAITYEIVLIVHYQMAKGILIWRLGLILTAFMVGAGLGAGTAIRLVKERVSDKLLIASLAILAAYIPAQFLITGLSFILANFLIGFLSGWIYQLVASQLVTDSSVIGKAAAISESSDHWGSAVGALVTSIVIIPLFGLKTALITACVLVFTATALHFILSRHSPKTIA